MNKEEILKLINQQIKIALQEFKQDLELETKNKETVIGRKRERADFISLQEFINKKNPRKVSSEEMPVIAYYLREIDKRKLDEIDEEIVKASYKKTDRVRPKRIKQAFIDNSFFDKVPQKLGFYKLNCDGEYFVEVTLKERKNKQH
jgi:hypothetical protein